MTLGGYAGGGRSNRPSNRQAQLGTASQPGERITLDPTDAARRGVENAVANFSAAAKVCFWRACSLEKRGSYLHQLLFMLACMQGMFRRAQCSFRPSTIGHSSEPQACRNFSADAEGLLSMQPCPDGTSSTPQCQAPPFLCVTGCADQM